MLDGSAAASPRMKALVPTLSLTLLVACDGGTVPDHGTGGDPPAVPADSDADLGAQDPAPAEVDAAGLYALYCASCHGEDGSGDGIVQLDRPARSFRDGGFSFGNTRTAIARTIASGIGGTPMPGFGAALSEEQQLALADYVIAFGPERPDTPAGATEMVVGERPEVARGGLPPIADGRPLMPRGLMLGGTDGLSWEYQADELRLLGVRQGAFVDRADWGERGGAALRPLGNLIYLAAWEEGRHDWAWTPAFANGSPGPGIPGADRGGAPEVPLTARLEATSLEGGDFAGIDDETRRIVLVEYLLIDPAGQAVARVRETGEAASVGDWSGFHLHFEVEPIRPEGLLLRRPLEEVGLGDELERFGHRGWDWVVRRRADGSAEVTAAPPAFLLGDAAPGQLVETHLFGRPWSDGDRESLMELLP